MIAWWRRLGYWLRGRRAAVELEDELQFHREMAERDLLQRGEPALDAARAARRAMGNTLLAREDARAVWVAPWLDGLWQDVRHGVRSLRRSPGLVIVSALSLGLGIGLNAMLYMGISTIFWHRPTMAEPARMVGVEPGSTNQFSHPDYQDLLASRIFDDAAGFRIESLNLGSGARVVRVGVLAVTANFFRVLGVEARQGRTFSPVDAAPEREPREVVVTAEFWRTSLGADSAAVGSTLVLNGESFTVVGVLPDGYQSVVGWVGPQIYAPLSRLTLQALNERRTPSLSVIARLPSSATARQAETAVTALMTSLERAYPDRLAAMGRTASVFPAADAQFRGVQRRFQQFATLALVMAGLVLLIACVNVSGLLMARATQRRREIAVRLAVGAGRARVVQSMLVESCLLVMAGAVHGARADVRPEPDFVSGLDGVGTGRHGCGYTAAAVRRHAGAGHDARVWSGSGPARDARRCRRGGSSGWGDRDPAPVVATDARHRPGRDVACAHRGVAAVRPEPVRRLPAWIWASTSNTGWSPGLGSTRPSTRERRGFRLPIASSSGSDRSPASRR